MRAQAVVWLILLAACVAVQAQVCPTENGDATQPSTLHGKIIYHDELRQWLGLKLDKPACDQSEVQLVFDKGDGFRAKTLRGCDAVVQGLLSPALTGYFSADIYIADPKITVDPGCKPKPLEPDLSNVKVPKTVNTYKAEIKIDYHGKGHVDISARDVQGQHLVPSQAYVEYLLTGSRDVIWFNCADGFVIRHPKQVPRVDHEIFEDEPNMAGTTLDDSGLNVITYTCTREK